MLFKGHFTVHNVLFQCTDLICNSLRSCDWDLLWKSQTHFQKKSALFRKERRVRSVEELKYLLEILSDFECNCVTVALINMLEINSCFILLVAIMSSTMVVRQPQPVMVVQESQEWGSDICDCCDDVPECKCLCSCVTFTHLSDNFTTVSVIAHVRDTHPA